MVNNFNFKKAFLVAMIVSLSISALIGILVFLFGNFGDTEFKLLMTTLAIGGYSLTGLCCSILYERKSALILAIFGMAVAIIGFLYTVLSIWELINFKNVFETLIIFIIITASTAHASLLLLIKYNKSSIKNVLFGTLTFIFIVALMLIMLVLNDKHHIDEFYYRLLGVVAILDVLGTIVAPVLNKIYSAKK